MTITINGTTGISGVDGSSSTPAFKGNDSNTGISFGTDTVTINTGGTARVTTDASGNVGVGVTPSAWANRAIEIQGNAFIGSSTQALTLSTNGYLSGSGWIYKTTGLSTAYGQSSGMHIWYNAPSGTAGTAISLTQAMTLDASGNLGIGQTSPAAKLDVNGTAFFGVGDRLRVYSNNVLQSAGTLDIGTIGSSALIFNTTNAERMRLDSSGNLGLGVTPSAWWTGAKAIQISAGMAIEARPGDATVFSIGANQYIGAAASRLYLTTNVASLYEQNAGSHRWYTAPSGTAGAAISFTQAMTLDASGNLFVGKTVTNFSVAGVRILPNGETQLTASNVGALQVNRITSTGPIAYWYYNGTNVGYVSTDGTSTSYVTTSDYRLKENIAPMTGALARVVALKPCTYTWKVDGSDGEGFIAHELQAVVPDAVTGEKDAVDEDGNPKYQGVDTSFLVATLTAAIQELKAEVDSLKAQLQGAA